MDSSSSSKPEIKVGFLETTMFDTIVPRKARSDENGNCLVTAASMDRIYTLLCEISREMTSIQKISYDMRKTPKEKIPFMDIVSLANKTSQTSEKAGKAMDLLYISAFFPSIKTEEREPSVYDRPCGIYMNDHFSEEDLAALMPVRLSMVVPEPAPVPVPVTVTEEVEEDLYA
jgi:hypothetical protein